MKSHSILTILMVIVLACSFAEAKYSGGTGEPNNPYKISSVADWQKLMVSPADWAGHFILTSDIDLYGVFIMPIAWDTSTDYDFQGTQFSGVFDGNNCVIRNADVYMPGFDYVGLFGYLGTNGQIKNLGVENTLVFGQNYVGGLVGCNDYGTISNCYYTGDVSGNSYVGGLVGGNGGTINNCYSTGSVSGNECVGGLCGRNSGTIIDCNATGNVSGNSYVGGLVGYREYGTISNCYSTGDVSGNSYIGGLVGYYYYYGTISNCYSSGPVNGNSYVGGLVGYKEYGDISNCYSTGTVAGDSYVGGLVGRNSGTISNCYSTGSITGTGSYVGGLVGSNNGHVSSCFWDIQTSGLTISAGGRGLTTGQMKTLSIFQNAGWGGKGWVMEDGVDYPHLAWEGTPGIPIPEAESVPLLGDGTEQNPYQIWTSEDFAILSRHILILDKHIELKADLDLAGIVLYPIGDLGGGFMGVFDGNDHVLRNVDVKVPGSDYVGLFDSLGTNGQIKNLGVEDISVFGHNYVGGLVGYNYGTISNCYSTGSVSGSSYVGGLVGLNYSTISNCYSTGDISGNSYIGGLVGYNSSGTISNCYSTGSVSGTIDYVGGLVGYKEYGTISNCYSTGDVSGNSYIGGLVGYNSSGTISNCYSTGSVTGTGSYIGGLVGRNSGPVSFCFWDIQTSGLATSAGGTGLTTAQMQTEGTFSCWAADGIWTIDEGKDYPRLWWENAPGHAITNYYYGGGSGTQADPYLIYTAEQLSIVGSIECDWDRHFKLMADIDLSGYDGKDGRPAFNIIGNYYNSFTGVFDGNDHIIRNADVNLSGSNYVGLFGYLRTNGQIKNLGVEDISVFGHNYVGGLVGYNSGTISNCYSTGNVSGNSYVGGLVGVNYGSISNCYSSCSVSGTGDYVGGLVGRNYGGTIINCYSSGSVTGTSYVGGLVGYGYNEYYGTISNCYSSGSVIGTDDYVGGLVGYTYYGTISNCYSTGSVAGSSHVGGLVGVNYYYGTISNCYSTGSVSGNGYVGGLVGNNNSGTISNCYSTSSVSGTGWNVGGLVGWNYGIISNCYSTGSVTGTGSYVGGLVGSNNGHVSSCFWDIQTSGLNTSSGGKGKTTAEMKTMSTFSDAGWDFVGETINGTCNFWLMPETEGYPVLFLSTFSGYIPPEPSGSGIEADPYIISDANELGTIWYRPSSHYVLANDIDLSDINWSGAVVPLFSGVFNGNDHTLRNIDINVPGSDYVGLFGYLGTNGQIKNLGVEDISIFGHNYVGGLVGYNYGTISNCYSTGSFTGGVYVGGIVGRNYSGAISNCYSTGSVIGTGDCVGGLVGNNNSGTISNCYSTGSVTGSSSAGGLVGYTYYGTISNCYSTSSVSGTGWNVGGLVGVDYYYGTISNCYSTGSVSGTGYVGGLVGNNNSGTIINCYSSGSVTGTSYVGGLVGYNEYGTITSSFWDIQTSGLNTSAGGTGKTTVEMKTMSTFTNARWDFVGETTNSTNDIWRMCVNGVQYPLLSWQFVPDFVCPDGVDILDLAFFVDKWLAECNETNNFCNCTDTNYDQQVDFRDYAILLSHWLEEK